MLNHKKGAVRRVGTNTLIVIKSLKQGDLNTADDLFDGTLRWFEYKVKEIKVPKPLLIETKDQLIELMSEVARAVQNHELYPWLHFEMHGSKAGLELSNGEQVIWEELLSMFLDINSECENNLFVSLATCFGGYIHDHIRIFERAPFAGYIGPVEKVSSESVIKSFSILFEQFIEEDVELVDAVKKMNTVDPELPDYRLQVDETIYVSVVNEFLVHLSEPKNLELFRQDLFDRISKPPFTQTHKAVKRARDLWRTNAGMELLLKRLETYKPVFLMQVPEEPFITPEIIGIPTFTD